MSIKVKKRDGSLEELALDKIYKQTGPATEGLKGVNKAELEIDSAIKFVNGIKTADIQNSLIQTAIDKIDIDRPNWTFVAARLFLYDLYHRVNGYSGYGHLADYIKKGQEEGRIVEGLETKYDLEELNSYIKPERDLQFNYLGVKTLYDRYIIKDKNGNPIELPQHMFMAIAMFLAHREEEPQFWAKRFYDLISKFEVMLATPTLSNARTPRSQLSSCFVGSTPDNIEGIFDSYKEMALLSKFGGGLGWDWNQVRAIGSNIDKHKGVGGGTVPFLKIANDTAIAVDQLGTRKGSIAVYMEPWHLDIYDFISLKKNSGEERRRAHDLFPALWLNDLFMQRASEDKEWTLFDPYEVPELSSLYGKDFEERYTELEKDPTKRKKTINAKALWKEVLRSYFETGSPFLTFKDTANRINPNSHTGVIRSSNLCTEIYENTEPTKYRMRVDFEDGSHLYFLETDKVGVVAFDREDIILINANKIMPIHKINGKQVVFVSKEAIEGSGKKAVCNLASVNLSKIHTKEDIERVIPIAIRMLDNVIDLNYYPIREAMITTKQTRAIGLGVMGESQMLAEKHIEWGSKRHFEVIDEVMENISYNAIKASSDLAIEKGTYPEFEDSKWSKGLFPIDFANKNALNLTERTIDTLKWDKLREQVRENGMRNGYLMAIAPTSSISILVGTTQAIEPVYKRRWYEVNLSGQIPVTAPNLSADTWNYYVSAYDLDQRLIIKAGSIRQKWIDQGQSLNIFMRLDKASGKYLNDIYMTAWKFGLKSTYYLRSQSPEALQDNEYTEDRSIECMGCQ